MKRAQIDIIMIIVAGIFLIIGLIQIERRIWQKINQCCDQPHAMKGEHIDNE